MHLKYNIIILIIGFLNLSESQAQINYFKYHSIINEAESLISEEDFDSALTKYDSAFEEFEYVFTKDYIVAAQLAAMLNLKEKCIFYMQQAMRSGLKCYCLKQLNQLENFLTNEEWEDLQKLEKPFRQLYLSQININLNHEFSKRFREEQESKGKDYYSDVLRANYFRIISLMDSMVYVSDRVIGIDETELDLKSNNIFSGLYDCDADNKKVLVTLLHSKDRISHLGMDRFIHAIELGYLHPKELYNIYEYSPNEIIWEWGDIKLYNRPNLKLTYSPNADVKRKNW